MVICLQHGNIIPLQIPLAHATNASRMLRILSTCFSATVVWQPALTTIYSGAESVCNKSYTSQNTYPVCTQAFHDCSTTRTFVLSIAELPGHSRCAFRSLFGAVLFFAGIAQLPNNLAKLSPCLHCLHASFATWLALGSGSPGHMCTVSGSRACANNSQVGAVSQLRNIGQKIQLWLKKAFNIREQGPLPKCGAET